MAVARNITLKVQTGTFTAPLLNSANTASTVSQSLTASLNGFNHSSNVTGIYGGRLAFSTQDFTDGAYVVFKLATIAYGLPNNYADTVANGGIRVYFVDGSGNYSGFNVDGKDVTGYDATDRTSFFTSYASNAQYAIERTATPDVSSGTLDWSDIVAVEAHVNMLVSNRPSLGIGDIGSCDVPDITGTSSLSAVATSYAASMGANIMAVMFFPSIPVYNGLYQFGYGAYLGMNIGDGSTATTIDESNFAIGYQNQFEDQSSSIVVTGRRTILANPRVITINQSASCSVALADFSIASSDELSIVVSGNTSGTCTFTRGSLLRFNVVELAHSASTDMIFEDCRYVLVDTNTALSGCTIRNNSLSGDEGLLIESAAGDYSDLDVTFNNNTGTDITIDPPSTGTWDLSGISVASGYTLKVHNKHASTAITVTVPAGITTSTSTAGGTVTIDQPVSTFTVNSSESSSLIQIFTTTTQTVLDSATSNTLAYAHSSETVDIVVQKAGFLPQRQTGIVLSGDQTINITLIADPVYDSAHGLTYTTDASWSRAGNTLTVPTFGPTVRGVYSLMIDSFIAQSTLYNTAFNIQMNGPNSMFLVENAEGASDASIENMTDGGVQYVNTSDTVTAQWVGVQSIGTATGFTGEYQQVDGSGTTDARATGAFDELIKMYGDASHGNFDYTGHLVLKYQVNGYYQSRVDVLATYGVSALEPTLYVVAMEPTATGISTGDPAISITITDHTAAPISVGGKSFDYEVVDNGTNSAEDILREINYNLSLDATYQSKDPFNYPDLVIESGGNYETQYGRVEGQDTTTTFHGVYVSRSSSDHPDFLRFQSNDGTYYTPTTTASISAPNLTAGRVEVVNATALAASAWQASTAYSLGDYVLRTTGAGTELGYGVFLVCTVAGTSGGSEPTWDVAADGNTTTDNTVTWTARPIQFDNATNTTGYSNTWVNGEHFASGDTIRLRWCAADSLPISSTGVATASGTTTFLDTPEDDTVYDGYAIDGSTVTEFAADIANVEVDVDDGDDLWYASRLYAWWKYNLTTANGIESFFGGLTAIDAANIRINNSVLDLYLDNVNANTAAQVDSIRLFRADGALPVVNPTSGGGGFSFYSTGVIYLAETGVSGLTAGESTNLASAASNAALALKRKEYIALKQSL